MFLKNHVIIRILLQSEPLTPTWSVDPRCSCGNRKTPFQCTERTNKGQIRNERQKISFHKVYIHLESGICDFVTEFDVWVPKDEFQRMMSDELSGDLVRQTDLRSGIGNGGSKTWQYYSGKWMVESKRVKTRLRLLNLSYESQSTCRH